MDRNDGHSPLFSPGLSPQSRDIVQARGSPGRFTITDIDMIPVGLASTLLSNVGSAIRSGLSQLAGRGNSASATATGASSQQTNFAAHLHAATSSTGTTGSHHHHLHPKGIVVSATDDVVPSSAKATGANAAVGTSINTSA